MRPFIFISSFVVQTFLYYVVNTSEATDQMKHLVGKLSSEDRLSSAPCLCGKNNDDTTQKPKISTPRERYRSPLLAGRNSLSTPLLSDIEAKERKERMDENMARFMQLMTFFGHVDNFLMQKTSGFLKIMGRAVDGDDYEEDYRPRYRPARRTGPKIQTTISS